MYIVFIQEVWVQIYGYFWLQSLCLLGACLWLGWVQSMRELGASLWRVLGACLCLLGACHGSVGCMYADVGCKVYGDVLGAKYMPFGCISDTADSLPDSRWLA